MRTGRRLFAYGLKQKKGFFLALLLLLVSVGTDLMGPMIVKQMIDNYIGVGKEMSGVFASAIRFLAFAGISAVSLYGARYLLERSANLVIKQMRDDVFAQTGKIPIKYFDSLPAGKIVSRITNDTEAIRELYVTITAMFCSGLIQIVGVLIFLFFLDYRLALICLVILPILYVWIVVYRKFATQYNEKIRSRLSDLNGMMAESIGGMGIIQVFRQEKRTKAEFDEMNEDYYRNQKQLLHINSATSHNLVGLFRILSFIAIVWFFGGEFLTGTAGISAGILYAFVDFLNRLFSPMTGMVNQLANLDAAIVSADRVFSLMDEEGEPVSEQSIPRYEGNVQFENVSFSYNDKDWVLKNISFQAKKGETIALVGHTGSGKSSMMNVLFGFYPYQKGRVTIDGQDIQAMEKQAYREHMGIVLQDPFLFTGTIASNVGLDNGHITREIIEQSIQAVGADTFVNQLPLGIDEPVLEKGSTFSTGERQLLSFARALAFDPAILILDEATANIDTETEVVIQKALEVVKKGRTTFIIAHRLSTIRGADQILVLELGEIIEQGNHEQLMELGGKYKQMYELQLSLTK